MASNQPDILQSTIDESDLTYAEFIDRGASGDVYHATWNSPTLGKVEAAAKKIPIRKEQNIDTLLRNEIQYLRKSDHPNIIKYYGHVVTKDHVVIVTEYAAKGSLYDYLKDKSSLPPELKLKWAIQGARGIKYLQDNQVLHRDIKSPNLLITADDNLKICDFGISKNLTSTKTTTSDKGTVRWLAPEVITELQLSPTADIYSFGIVLWELETCQEPYPGIAPMTVMYKVGSEGLRPEIPVTCSHVLRDLMQRCWDGDRANRPDIYEIISQLQLCLDGNMRKSPENSEIKQHLDGGAIPRRRRYDSDDVEPKRPRTSEGPEMISDWEINDVALHAHLSHGQLRVIYTELDIPPSDVENAHCNDFKLQAKQVLKRWRATKGRGATREAIMEALEECGCKEAKEILEQKWKHKQGDLILKQNDEEEIFFDTHSTPQGVAIPKRRRSDSDDEPTKRPRTSEGPEVISDREINDVALKASLSHGQLKAIYGELGISSSDVENAQRLADSNDFKLQAIEVLKYWRTTRGRGATKEAIIEALEKCGWKKAKDILEQKWIHSDDGEQKRPRTSEGPKLISDREINDVALKAPLSHGQLKAIYVELGISSSDVENAQRVVGSNDFRLQARNVLIRWRAARGGYSSRGAIIEALEECGWREAKEFLEQKWNYKKR